MNKEDFQLENSNAFAGDETLTNEAFDTYIKSVLGQTKNKVFVPIPEKFEDTDYIEKEVGITYDSNVWLSNNTNNFNAADGFEKVTVEQFASIAKPVGFMLFSVCLLDSKSISAKTYYFETVDEFNVFVSDKAYYLYDIYTFKNKTRYRVYIHQTNSSQL
jgi:hypothetical protein